MRVLFVLSNETAITLSGGTEAATGLGRRWNGGCRVIRRTD
jgi:hypothetical protein